LKEKKGILNYQAPTAQNALNIVGSTTNHETEDDIATKAITVLKNDNILPFRPTQSQKAVFITPYPNETTNCQFAMTKLIAKGSIPEMQYDTYYYYDSTANEEILSAIDESDYVFLFTEMSSPIDIAPNSVATSFPKTVIRYAEEHNKKCAVISIGKPYDVANYTDAQALLVAYGNMGMHSSDTDGSQPASYTYGPNIMAAIEVAFGYKNPAGVLPVDVPTIREDGSMDLSNIVFKQGAGMTYPDTKPEQQIQETATVGGEIKIDVSDEVAPRIDSRNIIQKLQDNGSFPIFVLLCVAVIIVLVVIIAIVSSRKKPKSKS